MNVEPFLKEGYRAGGRRGRGDEGGELGEDSVPVGLGPVGRRVKRAELGGAEGDQDGNMVGARGGEGGFHLMKAGARWELAKARLRTESLDEYVKRK